MNKKEKETKEDPLVRMAKYRGLKFEHEIENTEGEDFGEVEAGVGQGYSMYLIPQGYTTHCQMPQK